MYIYLHATVVYCHPQFSGFLKAWYFFILVIPVGFSQALFSPHDSISLCHPPPEGFHPPQVVWGGGCEVQPAAFSPAEDRIRSLLSQGRSLKTPWGFPRCPDLLRSPPAIRRRDVTRTPPPAPEWPLHSIGGHHSTSFVPRAIPFFFSVTYDGWASFQGLLFGPRHPLLDGGEGRICRIYPTASQGHYSPILQP